MLLKPILNNFIKSGSATVMVLISIAVMTVVGASLVLMQKNYFSAAIRIEEESVTQDIAHLCMNKVAQYLQSQALLNQFPTVTVETSLSATPSITTEITNYVNTNARGIRSLYSSSSLGSCTYAYLVGNDKISQGTVSGGEISTAREYNTNQQLEKFYSIVSKPSAGSASVETIFFVGLK